MQQITVGDLVKRLPKMGEWTKFNPWMVSEGDGDFGIVVRVCTDVFSESIDVLLHTGDILEWEDLCDWEVIHG